MRVRKGELTRRDFLKVTSIITGSALLSACSGILEIAPTLTPSPTLTGTPSSTPTQTPAPTQPEPTKTPKKNLNYH